MVNSLEEIIETCKLKHLSITFTGGEPLLFYQVLKIMVSKINQLSLLKKVTVEYLIITNGTLINNDIVDFLLANSICLQITFDGSKNEHNKFRFFDSKNGTFDLIFKNLLYLYQLEKIFVYIRINITSKHFDKYSDFLTLLYKSFPKFYIYVDFVDVKKISKYYISEQDKINFFYKYIKLQRTFNRYDCYNYTLGGMCMLRNPFSFTIDSNLNIYKCYSFIGTNFLKVGKKELFHNKYFLCEKEECNFFDFCSGGCIYKKYIVDNEFGVTCNYDFLRKINSTIFIAEVFNKNNKINFEEEINNVKYFSINI